MEKNEKNDYLSREQLAFLLGMDPSLFLNKEEIIKWFKFKKKYYAKHKKN